MGSVRILTERDCPIRDLITPDVLNIPQCSDNKSELHDIVAACVHVHKDYIASGWQDHQTALCISCSCSYRCTVKKKGSNSYSFEGVQRAGQIQPPRE